MVKTLPTCYYSSNFHWIFSFSTFSEMARLIFVVVCILTLLVGKSISGEYERCFQSCSDNYNKDCEQSMGRRSATVFSDVCQQLTEVYCVQKCQEYRIENPVTPQDEGQYESEDLRKREIEELKQILDSMN